MYNYLIYKTYDELKKAKSNGTKLSIEQEIFLKNMKLQEINEQWNKIQSIKLP